MPCPAQVRARRAGPVALAFQATARPSGVSALSTHQRAHTGGERPLAVAVAAVRAAAQLVGLRVHHGVHDLFGESGEQLPHVDGAVAETGHGEYVRRRV